MLLFLSLPATAADTVFAYVLVLPLVGHPGSMKAPTIVMDITLAGPFNNRPYAGCRPAVIVDPVPSLCPPTLRLAVHCHLRSAFRTVAATGTPQPAVAYGFGPGGAPRSLVGQTSAFRWLGRPAPRRELRARGRLWSSLRTLLVLQCLRHRLSLIHI